MTGPTRSKRSENLPRGGVFALALGTETRAPLSLPSENRREFLGSNSKV